MSPCDTRLPITLEILRKIIHSLPHTISNYVYRVIFSTMCIFAFHGFLRIGEICCKTKEGSAVIQQDDIHAVYHDGRPVGIELKLKKYKHSSQAVTIFLPACSHDSAVCPVGAFQLYKNVVVGACGPFFQFPGGKAVPYSFLMLICSKLFLFSATTPANTNHIPFVLELRHTLLYRAFQRKASKKWDAGNLTLCKTIFGYRS